MDKVKKFFIFILFGLFPLSCGSSEKSGFLFNKDFGKYWYQGEAEISSYDLQQARYGEIHEGHAVLIFVTEDFSKERQVKLDHPVQAGNDAVKVLKLNFTKKFNTGIYPYSMMTSVFTPVDREKFPNTLKISTSSQEWCGHTFTQFNLSPTGYDVKLFSYFEQEGDQLIRLPAMLTEDELWNLIRLSPELLPQGNIQLIPGTLNQRLDHSKFEAKNATAALSDHPTDESLRAYVVRYEDNERSLSIYFSREFPYEIQGWEEITTSGFGANEQVLTTKATLRERMMIDYWTKNSREDLHLRKDLGLDTN